MAQSLAEPQPIPPMLATSAPLQEVSEGYGLEFKWDGIRAQVHVWDRSLRVFTRNGRDVTDAFPELFPLKDSVDRPCVLDGEIVSLDTAGRPDFGRLQLRISLTDRPAIRRASVQEPALLLLFDILSLGGQDVTRRPYRERRRLLESLDLQGARWLTPPWYTGTGATLLEASRSMGLEGIVAKRLDSAYEPGRRTPDWLKVRNRMRQEFVVGGWTEGKGNREGTLGALLVGFHESPGGPLVYAGKVGSGFRGPDLPRLLRALNALAQPRSPFGPSEEVDPDAHFVDPVLVVETEFSGLTSYGILRQPSFKGLRSDKDPSEVVWEQVREPMREQPWHAHSGADRSVLAS